MTSETDEHTDRTKSGILFALAAVTALVLLWWLRDALLLAFAAILISVGLSAAANPLRRTSMPDRWAILSTLTAIVALFGLLGLLVGTQVWSQLGQLSTALRDAIQSIESSFDVALPAPSEIAQGENAPSILSDVVGWLAKWSGMVVSAIATLFVAVVGGVFLALNPDVYRNGFVRLFPGRYQDQVRRAISDSGRGLQLWLVGQLISMAIVGILVGLGAWVLGLPAPLALGIIAAVAEFVPTLGPILGALPAFLLAATQGLDTLMWTVVLFAVIQQLESNIIMPNLQREMVKIPAALFLFSVFAFGILLGLPGVLLAGPLTVVAFVLVRQAVGET